MIKAKMAILAGCFAALGPLGANPALAQKPYPTKTVRFISPFSAGGSTDILARLLGQKFSGDWGQPVVVENKPGAGGNVGAEVVAKSTPDGHTLLLSASSVAINPSLYARMAFDTRKDLAPVGLVGTVPNVIVVHPSLPVTTVQQLIALARKRPSGLEFASGGSGTGSHLIGELFQHMTNVKFVHVPYKGSGPATVALLSGECALAFNNLIAAIPHIHSGKMRALAVTSAQRSAFLPQVPTVAESGVPGFEADSWYGVFTTGRTPADVISVINRELVTTLAAPEVTRRLAQIGVTPKPLTPGEFQAFVEAEMTKWGKVVKLSGARVD